MKRSVALRFGLVTLAATAAVVAFVIGSQQEVAIRGNMGAAAGSGAGGSLPRITGSRMDDAKPAGRSPSPEFNRDLERRRTAWIHQPQGQQDNQMTPERVRRMEMSRFELASLAQEAAGIEMGLGEGERTDLRQILTDYRSAILLQIEHPTDTKALPAPTGYDPLEGLERRLDAPTSPANVYQKRMRERLGEERFIEFERLERQERSKLILERRVFRKTANEPGGGD